MTQERPVTGQRGRRAVAAACWLLASVLALASAMAVWTHQTLLTSNGWGGIVGEVVADEAVTDAVSALLVERLADRLGVQELVAGVVPGPDLIAGAITNAALGRVTEAVADFAATDTFHDAFVRANERAHDATMRVLRGGESEVVTSDDGLLALHIFPLIEGILVSLQDAGIIDGLRQVPDLSAAELPAQAVAMLESFLGREVPDDVDTIVLVDSERLSVVQSTIRWFDAATGALLLLWALFTGLALWLAERRVRMVLWLSAGAIATLLAGRVITRLVLEWVTRTEREPEAQVLVGAIVDAATDSFMWFTFVLMAVAVLIAVVAWFGERQGEAGRASLETPPRTLAKWVRDHAAIVLFAGVGLILVVALWSVGGPGVAMLVAAAMLLLAIGVKVVSEAAGEDPAPPPSPAAGPPPEA